jgi:molybdopterin-containing oxidoreductase family iron-sulfur binding subunit
MSDKKYWQSFGELNGSEDFIKKNADEFHNELPFEGFDENGLQDAKAPRRDFLKYLGFSTAAATIAASCTVPVKKAIPYANKPENLVSGEAKYYATTYVQDGDVVPVVAKVRDGRPIKLEGNTLCQYTNGGTSARAQASVLDLYDTNRVRFPKHNVNGKFEEVPTFEQLDKTISDALNNLNGAAVVFLTSTLVSPSSKKIIMDFLGKYPGSRVVEYDADNCSAMIMANEVSFGNKALPTYHFEKAKTIVSLGADFLGSWGNIVENARQYSTGRKIDEKNPLMSKHYQFESYLSTTGANADERFTHRNSETGTVALALLAALDSSVTVPAIEDKKLKSGIEKIAAELKANSGSSVVVCGSDDKNIQIVVNAINNAIGAYGNTIDWTVKNLSRAGVDRDMGDLVRLMEEGKVGTLLVNGANPAYNFQYADKFKAALKNVKLTISFNDRMDETTELCNYVIPSHHYLESWGDAEPKSGSISFIQPTIYPLFKTRQYQNTLLKWTGNTSDYETYLRNFWTSAGIADFDAALQNGVFQLPSPAASAGSYNGSNIETSLIVVAAAKKVTGDELVLYQKISLGTGAQAGNPWLQELPDPISKATWGNYALISLTKAKELNIQFDKKEYEYYQEKPVIKITATNGNSFELPVLVIPGMNANTIAVAVGYGRKEIFSKAAADMGVNVYPFANATADIKVEKISREEKVAQMQIHNSYEDRFEVVRETTLATLKKYPDLISGHREELADDFAKKTKDYRTDATLYPMHTQPGIKWGMNVDMNSCYGCGACVVACHAENNVPVVGKREVIRYHDMHWLRLDRYFVTDKENPDDLKGVVFQPMMCQHCDNAPCENVCPVAATNHSSEGLNQMTYNRCIGTRYCANNCPYKVRRFNWSDYTGADSFKNNQDQQLVGKLDVAVHQMNEDLTRMVLNPDVTVRSRGVIEKCSFCVQKLQAAKLTAKKENRMLQDGDAKTACQTACPTQAIVFGNAHDKESEVSKLREDNEQRLFYVIEQIHTLPNVSYLAKVRNTEEVIESAHGGGEHEEKKAEGGGEKKEAAPAVH